MRRIFSLIIGSALVFSVSGSTVSCSGKKHKETNPPVPPVVVAADGTSCTIPCGSFYEVKIPDTENDPARNFCKSLGIEYSDDALNSVWFGENVYGAGLASVVFFGKYASSLSEAEWDSLAEVAKAPDKYADILSGSGASDESLFSEYSGYASRIPESAYYDAMIEEIVRDLVNSGKYTRAGAFELMYSGGITIETPFSPETQRAVDEVYSNSESFTTEPGKIFPQSACVVMDYSGNVLAMAGGNNGNYAYNRAYRTLHSIGSTVKPIAVYAPAISGNMVGFSTLVEDGPVSLEEDKSLTQWPANYDKIYEGNVTVTYALRQSKNTVPVRLLQMLGLDVSYSFMKNDLHFSAFDDNDLNYSSLGMGYLANGALLTELAASYQMFGNGGYYFTPRFYTRVTDGKGAVILDNESESKALIGADDSWIMNRLLYYNVSAKNGIASAAKLDNGCEVIGKTGTVDDKYGMDTEKLFVGGTPDYLSAVWIGFDNNQESISNLPYRSPTVIWKNIMERLPAVHSEFVPDETVETAVFCTSSGGLAGKKCPDTETGYYKPGMLPDQCGMH